MMMSAYFSKNSFSCNFCHQILSICESIFITENNIRDVTTGTVKGAHNLEHFGRKHLEHFLFVV